MAKKILISDPTLRDGNHAVRHQLSREAFIAYCQAAEAARVPIIEVCLLYTSPSPRDRQKSRMPSSA